MSVTRVSTDENGQQGNDFSQTLGSTAQLSQSGRYVVFESGANNLVDGDGNGQADIFVKDLVTGTVTRVSTAGDGTEADGASSGATISGDGRYVAFLSNAGNLVAGDTNGTTDIFVKDLSDGSITRVNTARDGQSAGDGTRLNAVISADGRHVAFASDSGDLVAGGTNGQQQVYARNLDTNVTTQVSTGAGGTAGNGTSGGFGFTDSPALSADGRFVAFSSDADDLVAGDTNGVADIFVKDLSDGSIRRVSTASDGAQADGGSLGVSLSADGTRIAFTSEATNLVGGDANGRADVFVKDLRTGVVTRASAGLGGTDGDADSFSASLSGDGTRVAFASNASNLVAGDTNGQIDVFVADLATGTTTRVSTQDGGAQTGTGPSFYAALSGDGSRVAFTSAATDLVAGDTNDRPDVFVSEVACYAAGSAIRAVRDGIEGDLAVEDLTVGDLAVTAGGRHAPIRWLGHRTIDCTRHPEPHMAWPVRIAKDALGRDRPARDLLVSPDHCLCLDLLGEVLIPARRLLNGSTIVQVAVARVTYWHVELDAHDILLAENLPAESYRDCGNRAFFAETDREPDAAPASGDPAAPPVPACRPLHESGPLVDSVRARLADLAQGLGWHRIEATVADDLHVVADGAVIRPDVVDLAARFVLPAEVRDVRLVSGSSTPAHVEAESLDHRRLGVSLAALVFDDGLSEARAIALDDPRLVQGFHPVETGTDGASWRWTDGSAVLPAALWEGCRGTMFLRLTLTRPPLPRWVGPKDAAGVVDLTQIRRRPQADRPQDD